MSYEPQINEATGQREAQPEIHRQQKKIGLNKPNFDPVTTLEPKARVIGSQTASCARGDSRKLSNDCQVSAYCF